MYKYYAIVGLLLLLCLLPIQAKTPYRQIGLASWYGFESGKKTASGEKWRPNGITAASWHLPFGARVKVTHLKSGKSVVVRINDRGPARRLKRVIDLSHGAAKKIDLLHSGVGQVLVEEVR